LLGLTSGGHKGSLILVVLDYQLNLAANGEELAAQIISMGFF
jgi:hypothetical protein